MAVVKPLFVALLVVHGLIHLMGFVKAFGLAEVPQLSMPISHAMGVGWLIATIALLAAAATCHASPTWFWAVGGVALVLSQTLIILAWSDARFGTVANVVLLVGVVLGFVAHGPGSLRAEYRAAVRSSLEVAVSPRLVTEDDLRRLPRPVQRYLRTAGAVGQPQIDSFKAVWHGRIRATVSAPWMTFRAEQYNFFGAPPVRLFFMDATMKHLPVDVFHRFVGDAATFRVRLLSAFTVIDAAGPAMNRGETVTLFNDLCILAPGRLIDPSIEWTEVDETHTRARYTRGAETITAELVFAASGELIDFISDDRMAASADGKTFTAQRWHTPVRDYRGFGMRRASSNAEARWIPASGEFAYLEIELERVDYNLTARRTYASEPTARRSRSPSGEATRTTT